MFMGPQNWFQGMNSASLCSLAGRYENPIPPRSLAPIGFLKNSSSVDTIQYTGSIAGQYACLCDISSKARSGRKWDQQYAYLQSLSINVSSFSSKFGNYWFIYYFKAVSSIPFVFRSCLVGSVDLPLFLLFWQIFSFSSVRTFATSYVNYLHGSFLFHIHNHP